MMYLTRMFLNPARRGTRRLLSSPQVMHAAVLAGFPPGGHDVKDRPLWRVDRDHRDDVTLYVSSPDRPDFTHLVEQGGWPSLEQTWSTVDTGPFLDRLAKGQRWRFRLTANPVVAKPTGPGNRGKPVGLRTVDGQTTWLTDRAGGHGFRIPENSHEALELVVRDSTVERFRRKSDGSSRTVVLNKATFEGLLEVDDPVQLRESLRTGIGRGKAYGCGLLTLAPVV